MRPKMISLLTLAVLVLASGHARAQTDLDADTIVAPVAYTAFAMTPAGERRPLASDTVDSRPGAETRVLLAGPDSHLWTRRVVLPGGFQLVASYLDHVDSLFISIEKDTERGIGFNYFRRDENGVFRAAEGGTRIRVSAAEVDDDLRTLEVLDDITLIYRTLPGADVPRREEEHFEAIPVTHEIVLHQGSFIQVVHGTDLGEQ